MIRVEVRRRTPSQNKSTYSHWSAYAKERDAWFVLLRAALRPRATPPDRKVNASIVSYRNRLLDFANLVGGCKPIPDGLIKLGYLRDDKPAWFACEYRQQQCRRAEERTVITLDL